jgi:hypothetical protein
MIDPKCLKNQQCFGFSSRGFILPCCYYDNEYSLKFDAPQFIEEKLNLNNVNSIEEIFNSEAWQTFFEQLDSKSENLPYPCHYYCSDNSTPNKISL